MFNKRSTTTPAQPHAESSANARKKPLIRQANIQAQAIPGLADKQNHKSPIPRLAQKQQRDITIQISASIDLTNALLTYIQAFPEKSFDLTAKDDVAKSTFNLINRLIDYRIVSASSAIFQALQQNSTLLERFFKEASHAPAAFTPVIIPSATSVSFGASQTPTLFAPASGTVHPAVTSIDAPTLV